MLSAACFEFWASFSGLQYVGVVHVFRIFNTQSVVKFLRIVVIIIILWFIFLQWKKTYFLFQSAFWNLYWWWFKSFQITQFQKEITLLDFCQWIIFQRETCKYNFILMFILENKWDIVSKSSLFIYILFQIQSNAPLAKQNFCHFLRGLRASFCVN